LFNSLGTVLLILGVVSWLRSDFWRIKKVDCHLNGEPCSSSLWAELFNLTSGKNILFLSSSNLSGQIKQNHPELLQVQIDKQLPHDLLVEIQVRRAVVAISSQGEEFYLADEDGVLLEKMNQPPDLPMILVADKISRDVGGRIQEEIILKEIQILHESQLRLLEPKSAQAVSERVIEVWFNDDLQALFSVQKDIDVQLDSLQFILERTKIEGEKPKRIDLRFDKPVIVN